MSRRSGREKPQKTAAALPESVKLGLASIIAGNEVAIAGMLDASPDSDLLGALLGVLAVNSLSPEGLLAQWFSTPILSTYAQRIGKSSKGNEIILAARIASAWAKPSFQPPSDFQQRWPNPPSSLLRTSNRGNLRKQPRKDLGRP
ncbi:hypothetical protein T484DRAFT_2092895 [Baffinella frigidus]|nr:hypothetical protein T484DRAFT_2092895 [Cryptophyta sp. CCMP2293]